MTHSPSPEATHPLPALTHPPMCLALHCMAWPRRFFNGWLTFGCALAMIGIITAIIGDLASLMGCAMGLEVRVLQGQPSPHHHHIVLLPHSSNSPPPLPLCCNTVTRAFLRSPIGRRDSDHICRTRHITARHICVHVRCRRLRHRRFGAQRLHDGTNHPPPKKKKKAADRNSITATTTRT